MIPKLAKNWLLILAALLQAVFAVVNLLMRNPDSTALRNFASENPSILMTQLATAAGLCTIAAAVWSFSGSRRRKESSKGKAALLALDGLALGAYGLIPAMWGNRPLSLRPYFALLLVAMAASVGLAALAAARTLRDRVAGEWLLGLAGAASLGFALAFVALDLRWIDVVQPGAFFLLLAAFFGLSAACLLALAVRLKGAPAMSRTA